MLEETDSLDRSIDRYLTGEMPEAEREAFRIRLARDPKASALIDADRQISKVTEQQAALATPNVPPNPMLLQYLSEMQPHGRLAAYVAAGGFAVLLGLLLVLQVNYSRQSFSTAPASNPSIMHSSNPVLISPSNRTGQATPMLSTPPIINKTESATMVEPNARVLKTQRVKPATRDLDEQLGKPRVYTNDSVSVRIHSK